MNRIAPEYYKTNTEAKDRCETPLSFGVAKIDNDEEITYNIKDKNADVRKKK